MTTNNTDVVNTLSSENKTQDDSEFLPDLTIELKNIPEVYALIVNSEIDKGQATGLLTGKLSICSDLIKRYQELYALPIDRTYQETIARNAEQFLAENEAESFQSVNLSAKACLAKISVALRELRSEISASLQEKEYGNNNIHQCMLSYSQKMYTFIDAVAAELESLKAPSFSMFSR
jgi:hypothetical protein